jgi:hypothetical protein
MTAAKSRTDSSIPNPEFPLSPAMWENFIPSKAVMDRFSEANAQASQRLAEGMALWTKEVGDFAVERMTQDMETLRRFGACRSPEEMVETQMKFAQTAAEQYMREAGKLLDLATRTCVDCMKPLDDAAKVTSEEIVHEPAGPKAA